MAGVSVAISFGIIFSVLFYVAKNNVFSGQGKYIFTVSLEPGAVLARAAFSLSLSVHQLL